MQKVFPQVKMHPKFARSLRWVLSFLLLTVVYIPVSWLTLEYGMHFLGLDESHETIVGVGLALIYIILSTSLGYYRPLRDKTTPLERRGTIEEKLAGIRGSNNLYSDEIDMLVKSLRTMHANLEKQKSELVTGREKMQELARTTLRAQEAEKRHIARELHDQAGQLLASLRYRVDALLAELEAGDDTPAGTPPLDAETIRQRLDIMLVQIDKTIVAVRGLSHKMRPALLDVGDINLAMQDYCGEFQEGKRITIHYDGTNLPAIPEEAATSLFRFLQEALTNVLKHANATSVHVQLTQAGDWVEMSVEDDGRGGHSSNGKMGIGLIGMTERFDLLGGRVEAVHGDSGGANSGAQCTGAPPPAERPAGGRGVVAGRLSRIVAASPRRIP